MIKTLSVWQTEEPPLTNDDQLQDSVDIAIVGGGITGLCAGIELLKAGLSVQIFEAGNLFSGASSKAFGSIAMGASQSINKLTQYYGKELAENLWLESTNAIFDFEKFIKQHNIDCDFHRGGHIKIAFHKQQCKNLINEYEKWKILYPQGGVELLYGDTLSDNWPGKKAKVGLLDTISASINPPKYFLELFHIYKKLGGLYITNCRVKRVLQQKNIDCELIHCQGNTKSKKILLATNGYTDKLFPWLYKRIMKVGSYMVATKPLSKEELDEFNGLRRTFTTAYNFKQYCRLDHQNRLIFGGRLGLSTGLKTEILLKELDDLIKTYFPSFQVKITHVWGGNLGFSIDGLPHIGRVGEIYYSIGYCGRGLPMATLLGRNIAKKMLSPSQKDLYIAKTKFKHFPWFKSTTTFSKLLSSYLLWQDKKIKIDH